LGTLFLLAAIFFLLSYLADRVTLLLLWFKVGSKVKRKEKEKKEEESAASDLEIHVLLRFMFHL
jgi:hypothetical protein